MRTSGRNQPDDRNGVNGPDPDSALTEMLREADIVSEDVLNWAKDEGRLSGRRVYELLVERVPVLERDVWRVLATYLGVPFDDLTARVQSSDLARRVPSHLAFTHHLAPVAIAAGVMTVAVSHPETVGMLDEVAAAAGAEVTAVLTPPTDLERFIRELYGLGAETVNELAAPAGEAEGPIRIIGSESHSLTESLDSDQQASITRFVNQILIQAIKDGASDVHIEPYERQLRVRFRVDGQLQEVPVPPTIKQFESAIISRVKVLANLDIAEKRLCQDGQMRLVVLGRAVDVRVSVLPTIYGEALVLRLLDRQSLFRRLDKIGMAEGMLRDYCRLLDLAQGLILVTGPTGSGKTTTLYSSLTYVNRPRRKIITIEDPVEYRLEGITQIQVKESIGLSFSNLLRNILRHDPDVIMIGEIRDRETANMALSAAMTGHLVFASLHTNDAPTTVVRLRNMGAPPYLIAAGLELVVAQRLVRTICPTCRREEEPLTEKILAEFPLLAGRPLFSGTGCEACRFTGYKGRTALFEFFVATNEVNEMVLAGESTVALYDRALQQGMVPLRQAGMELVAQGHTTFGEIMRVTRNVRQAATGLIDEKGPAS